MIDSNNTLKTLCIYCGIFTVGIISGAVITIFADNTNNKVTDEDTMYSATTNSHTNDPYNVDSQCIDSQNFAFQHEKSKVKETFKFKHSNQVVQNNKKSIKHRNTNQLLSDLEELLYDNPTLEFNQKTANLLNDLTMVDPEAALSWLLSMEPSDNTDKYLSMVLNTYAEIDFEQAGNAIIGLPQTDSLIQFSQQYARTLTEEDPYSALAWSENFANKDIANELKDKVYDSWLNKNPNDALLALSSDQDIDPSVRAHYVTNAASLISQYDPAASALGISQIDKELQPDFAYGVSQSWIEQDVNAAYSWVVSLEQGATKDKAIQGLIDSGENLDLAEKFDLALSTSNEAFRTDLALNSFMNWYGEDPEAATRALEFSNVLTTEHKNLFLGRAKRVYR